MFLAAGKPDSALRMWELSDSEGATFWRGCVLRARDRSTGDSLLHMVASAPGFSFYRTAARESLGVRGWPLALVTPATYPQDRALRMGRMLLGLGMNDDAAFVLERWAAGDPRAELVNPEEAGITSVIRRSDGTSQKEPNYPPVAERPATKWLAAAAIAYAAGFPRPASRYVERALAAPGDSSDASRSAMMVWLYPPALDALLATYPDSTGADVPNRSLLRAVVWQESRFDTRARSRSDARGLMQLKRDAAADVARWLHEKAPPDSALFDPALNLRYGSRYLARMMQQFPGNLPLALAAYNAGPGVAARWGRLRRIGGDALVCEEISRAETEDYVKSILAARQAYRELRPTAEP
jgi:soluble lytic murein transglycosylase-like protein